MLTVAVSATYALSYKHREVLSHTCTECHARRALQHDKGLVCAGAAEDLRSSKEPEDSSNTTGKRSGPRADPMQGSKSARRFIDDAAAGSGRLTKDGHADDDADSDSEQKPAGCTPPGDEAGSQGRSPGHQRPARARITAIDSSSSDSDAPLRARRSGSVPSQPLSPDHDSDFATERHSSARRPGSSATGSAEAPLRSVNALHQLPEQAPTRQKRLQRSLEKQRRKSKETGTAVQGNTNSKEQLGRESTGIAPMQDSPSAGADALARRLGTNSPDVDAEREEDAGSVPGAEEIPAEDRPTLAEEAVPAFEMPSQMPKELQTWAWDKYAPHL